MRSPALLLVLTAFVTTSAACAADEAELARKDAAAVRACVAAKFKAKGAGPETCIGQVSKVCAKATGNRNDSTVRDCARRETEAWTSMLADVQEKLGKHLDADQKAKLTAMQEGWTTARDRSCAFFYDYFDGSMAHPMIASCLNRETARRAMFLNAFLQDAEGN